ncbi:MAG: dihydroneopterin aldolase [Proteobacteria bacterium]|nr:dihydroneopterin aldolase [Pseudomonadota bacterium]
MNEVTARRVVVRGLALDARIGAYARERNGPQPVRIDLVLEVAPGPLSDDLAAAVSYDDVIAAIRRLVAGAHIQLAETLAERIADVCLADPRVKAATVRVEKPDAVADAAGVGAEVVKTRADGAK